MAITQNLLKPLRDALPSVLRRSRDPLLWLPFLALGCVKLLLFASLARFDLLPSAVVAALLAVAPEAERALQYPSLVLRLPEVARTVDLVLFVSLGALVQGWAISRLARGWTGRALPLIPNGRSGAARCLALMLLAGTMAGVPVLVRLAGGFVGGSGFAPWAALVSGLALQMVLFTAPAFRIIDDVSIVQSVVRSAVALARLPLAIPLAIVFLAALHLPSILLQSPAIAAGAHRDPDWIFFAVAAQVPVDVCGAFLSAGLAARFMLSGRIRRQPL